ncbi:MAG: ATP-binding cassette domain-containing protein, partial [Lachnospiraceae bacterium]|nr:ATP-binding cassette domain-containing protein [Lachnospiraceae bacterium]
MKLINIKNLTFEYFRRDDEGNIEEMVKALQDVSLDVKPGEFIAILGRNGSGKSTLAKHINALLLPGEGEVIVDGMDTCDEEVRLQIRQTAGMVFQNPDNQIVGNLVEEDIAFGPENLGVPTADIWNRVEDALRVTDMELFRKQSPNHLSGGQKQRVAIAGVLAMHPKC